MPGDDHLDLLELRAALIVRGYPGRGIAGVTVETVARGLYVEIARAVGCPGDGNGREADRAVLEVLIAGDLELMRLCDDHEPLRKIFAGCPGHETLFARTSLETDLWTWIGTNDAPAWRELAGGLEEEEEE